MGRISGIPGIARMARIWRIARILDPGMAGRMAGILGSGCQDQRIWDPGSWDAGSGDGWDP